MSIDNVNQLVTMKLLNALSASNSNSRTSSTNKSDVFSLILENTLGGLNQESSSCTCSKEGDLNILNTLQSLINNNKIDESQNANQIKNIIEPKKDINVEKITDSKKVVNMDKAIDLLEKQLGKKYVWGATGPNSFDCSGLVQYVYKNALGKDIPRVSSDQSKFGKAIDKKDLQVGDLLFFDTMNKGRVSHVGMYVGNNEFIHASNPKDGVKKSKLSGYYEQKYSGARRP